jgi:HK97 family phage major capsid protein
MQTQSHPVARGIQFVHAETDLPKIIEGVNAAFTEFKANHTKQLDAVITEVDAINTRMAAQDMNGPAPIEAPVLPGVKALRTYSGFKAHYANAAKGTEKIGITDFLRGIAGMETTEAVRASLSVGTNTAGGYSVPAQTAPEILAAMVPASALLTAGAGIVLLEAGAKSVTTAVIDTIPTAGWRTEKGAVVESDPAFRGVVAAPQSLAFYFKISRELLADGQGIEMALRVAIAQAFAKELDRAGLRGSGTAPEPRGIRNTAGVQIVTNGANGAALAGYAGFLSGIGALLDANAPMPTAAIVAPRSLVKLSGLMDTTGQPLRKPEMVATLPLIVTSQIPTNITTGTSTDTSEIYLGDFTKLHFLIRENVSIQLLREAFSTTGEIGFLCHARADVVLTQPAAFAVVTGIKA